MTEQKELMEKLRPIIDLMNQCPTGIPIPSDWQAPEGYELEKTEVNGVPVEHLIPPVKNGKVILQFHGGGFLYPYLDSYRNIACMYSNAAKGAEVYSVDYRIAPMYKFPCAHEDCLNTYRLLLDRGVNSKDIIIIGDSAGGNLVLSVILQIKELGLPLPKAAISISPWANFDGKYEARKNNYEKDLILGKYGMTVGKIVYDPSFYTEESNYSNPFISPVYGDYNGFPDLLLQVGSYELLLDDVLAVADQAREKGVNVKLSIFEGMSHVFQLFLIDTEEGKKAWAEISEFMCQEFGL